MMLGIFWFCMLNVVCESIMVGVDLCFFVIVMSLYSRNDIMILMIEMIVVC